MMIHARASSLLPTCLALLLAAAGPARAHMRPGPPVPAAPEPRVTVEKVGEGAWCLFGQGGNLGVVATPGSLLVVDTQYEPIAPELLEAIRRLSDAPIRFVVNTHFHIDHTGGNGVFVREAPKAALVAHQEVRRRLYHGHEAWLREFPGRIQAIDAILGGGRELGGRYRSLLEKAVGFLRRRLEESRAFDPDKVVAPTVGFEHALRLYPGGEEVVLFHEGPGHTDGDSWVWIPGRNVLHMGDLFWNGHYPLIDVDAGGASEGWLKNLDAALAILPGDARVIAGHGQVGGRQELEHFRSYLRDLRAAVAGAMASGRSLEQAVEEIRLDGYDDLKSGFMSLEANIAQVWQEMGGSLESPGS